MAVGDIYRLAVRSTYNNIDDIVNVLHYRQELVVVGNPAEDLANQWATDLMTLYTALFPGAISVTDITVRPIPPATEFFDLSLTPQAGAQPGQVLPLFSAPIITWRSDFIGRSKRGRSYLPPLSESFQDAGTIDAAVIAGMDNYAIAAMQLLELGIPQWQLVVYSATLGSAVPVTGHVSRPLLGSQRRRKQGVGG